VDGVLPQSAAVNAVVGIGGDASDRVTGIYIFEIDFRSRFLKMLIYLFLQKGTNIEKFGIA